MNTGRTVFEIVLSFYYNEGASDIRGDKMRGEIVIVRSYRDRPLVRRAWDANNQLVFIVDESHFQSLIEGRERAVGLIGFPKEDVFKYDPKLAEAIDECSDKECFIWDKLRPLIE
jgi:hypothetical protein